VETTRVPELWQWAEYYCPWCYVAAVRLNRIWPEYQGRVRLRERAFPLEVYGGGPPDRRELELEMWLAAVQEPEAKFTTFEGNDWPTTTLPAFEAAWCANQQGETLGHDFDLRIRHAFFAEGRNIGRCDVMVELATEAGLDLDLFNGMFGSGEARAAVLAEGRLGKVQFGVRGTPTVMTEAGSKLRHALAYPDIQDGRILAVSSAPCCGTGCDPATRALFEQALPHTQASHLG
jgi:putative protein-disulfide isomerase